VVILTSDVIVEERKGMIIDNSLCKQCDTKVEISFIFKNYNLKVCTRTSAD
jgi:hypothetical protein